MSGMQLGLQAKITLLTIVSAACIGSSIVSPCLPYITKYFNISSNHTSTLMSTYLIGYLFGQFFYSVLSKKFGYHNALRAGFFIYIIGAIIQLLAIKINLFNLLNYSRFFCAAGASSGLICSFSIFNEFFDKEESRKLISIAFISLTISSYLSITLGSILINFFGFESIFYALIFIAIMQCLTIYLFIPKLLIINDKKLGTGLKFFANYVKSLTNVKLILTSIIVAFTTTTTYLYATTAPAIAYNILHITPSSFGIYSLVNLIGLILGGYLSSALSKKYPVSNILVNGFIISMVSLLFFLLAEGYLINDENVACFFILTAILNLGLGLIYPSASYLAINSISCNATSSSIMNIIKIGCPSIVIFAVSRSNLTLVDSFKVPLVILFLIAALSFFILKINGSLKNS